MMKQTDTQQQRTRKKGEVFSPAWVCNKMNNALDADWFRGLGAGETAGQFTVKLPQGWQTVETSVQFPACGGKTLSVYDFCKQVDAQTVLIVTNRPAIANSWYSDYSRHNVKQKALGLTPLLCVFFGSVLQQGMLVRLVQIQADLSLFSQRTPHLRAIIRCHGT